MQALENNSIIFSFFFLFSLTMTKRDSAATGRAVNAIAHERTGRVYLKSIKCCIGSGGPLTDDKYFPFLFIFPVLKSQV